MANPSDELFVQMSTPEFDHIEVHVLDVTRYCRFLQALFDGGRFRQISESGTSMFKTPSGINIEVKRAQALVPKEPGGFCLPCVRCEGARGLIVDKLGLTIERTIVNSAGEVHFFRDHEGIEWHMKDYSDLDEYIDW